MSLDQERLSFDRATSDPGDLSTDVYTKAEEVAPFDLCGPLPQGVTVLEASAGTGKTYTIAALTARFVAEGVPLEQLLLVTFTRVATSELRERVRERLVNTEAGLARVVGGASARGLDDVTALLAAGTPAEVASRQRALGHAIANFDAATIETTHGFCQKVLDDLGTLAESEPGVQFVDNVEDLAREVIDDLYVRRFHRRRDNLDMSREEAQRIAELAINNPLAQIHPLDAPPGSAAAMRRRLAVAVKAELEARKRGSSLMTHDDQLTRLLATLEGSGGEAAVTALRERYRVILIDEFQDTDPVQWRIVSLAFAGGETTLILIGDPKQAVYAFRGADVQAYLEAAGTAGTRATLAVNHRSDQALLDGLDALFGNAQLGHPGIVYRKVSAAPLNQRARLRGGPAGSVDSGGGEPLDSAGGVPVDSARDGSGLVAALRFRLLDANELSVARTPGGFPQADSTRAFVARDVAAQVASLLSSGAVIETREREGATDPLTALAPGHIAVLVRTHRQAALIQSELETVGVPAVIGGSGSVFATSAGGDWLALLEALEQPAHPARARTAALTPLVGWSAEQLALAGEAQLERLHRQLHAQSRVLREHGIASLADTVLAGGQLAERLLSLVGGERRLTDLQHVAQLLAGAAEESALGVAALSAWLRERIEAAEREGSNDERARRLDSDADAVQIVTIHRSKGLEFPVVFCPFLWEPGRLAQEGEPVYFHDAGGERAIDVGLAGEGYRAHLLSHNVDERGEELRLAYVALTRARHQAVVWWASGYNAKDSPLGRLLFARSADGRIDWAPGRRPREDAARAGFEQVAQAAPHAVSVEIARLGPPGRWRPATPPPEALARAQFERSLDASWRRTSYTALTAGAHELIFASEPEATGVADEPATAGGVASDVPLSTMASGAQLGTLIHRLLQALEFDGADRPGRETAITNWLTAATAGRRDLTGAPAAEVAAGLATALETPLGGALGGLALTQVPRRDRLDELEFELPLAGGDQPLKAARLRAVGELLDRFVAPDDPLAGYGARLSDPSMSSRLRGYLTGSIDLVLRVRSQRADRPRYAIIDYKTNWLGLPGAALSLADYAPAALAREMQRSHYVLQGLLYSVALHRYLRWRLADYDPVTDLIGFHYLFLRGMVGPSSPGSGVFHWQPPAQLVVELSDLLAGTEGPS